MKVCLTAVAVSALGLALAAAANDYLSAKEKIDRIESDRLKPGSRVELTPGELNAYAGHEQPAGVRNAKLEVPAAGVATGSALVDFGKLARAEGWQPGRLMAMLLDGERPVSVTVRIHSSSGRATVDVQRVDIAGMEIDGATLDFLIRNVLMPLYPDVVVGRPFDLGHHIERLDVQPRAVGVVIGR
ncbi:MAG: hypothetical protein ABSC23_02995 [Bryobacteraceae bacterium]